MTGLKLITFDLDNTLWPVDEVIRQAEKTCSDWIAEHHPSAAAALTAERVRTVRDELVRAHPAPQVKDTEHRRVVHRRLCGLHHLKGTAGGALRFRTIAVAV